ncbi:hypothetical protein [Rhodanobacter aciditrophus]|uniref:hypothetical protein n=1 Tax=Rhodanobacter aciditrophus TaxID=1623218 RepID=UPI003CEEA618
MLFHLPSPRRSRHPLVRALSLLLGVAMLGVLLVFGLAVAGVLLVGGGLLLAWRQWKQVRAPIAPATKPARPAADVLEGEFVVIRRGPVTH